MGKSAAERARARAKTMGDAKSHTLKENENTQRILPTPADKTGENEIYIEYQVHKGLGDSKRWFTCGHSPAPMGSKKDKCIACDKEIPRLESKGKVDRAAAMAPANIVGVNISPVTEEGKFLPRKPWVISAQSLQRMVLNVIGNTKRSYTDPKKGYNFTITRTGMKFNNTKYIGPDADEEKSKVPDKILEGLLPFAKDTKNWQPYDEEAMRKALYGKDSDDDDEDEDEDEEEEDIDLDDDEDKSSKKKKKSKKSKDEDEDDEDEDDEDEDEEDEDEDDDSEDDEDSDDEDEDSESDDEDEESEHKSKKKNKGGKGSSKNKNKSVKKKKKSKDEDDEDEDEDEDEDDD